MATKPSPVAMRSRASLWATAILAFFGLMGLIRLLPSLLTASTGGVLVREAALAGAALLLVLGLLWGAREPASGLGLVRPKASTLGFAVLGFALAMLISAGAAYVASRAGMDVGQSVLARLGTRPVWLLLLIALTAAISEEIVFRGVMLTRIEAASGSTWLAALVSLAAFAGAHAPRWGVAYVALAALPGLVLTLFYLWRRDLIACILTHFLIDAAGLLALTSQVAQSR